MKKYTTEQKRKLIAERFKGSGFLGYPKIDVDMGNFANPGYCHINARQALENGKAEGVVQVIFINPDGTIRLHWIEQLGLDSYIDNTLGYLSRVRTYYLIKRYTLSDLKNLPMHEVNDKAKRDFLASLFTTKELKKYKFELTDI